MLKEVAYFLILGKPLIFYLGIITFLSFCFTAFIAILNQKRIYFISFKWHSRMAIISIILAVLHGLMASSIYWSN